MGFFSKIKDNLKHGGVKISMQAPQSVSKADPNLPVTVSVTNGPDEARTINKVTVSVTATTYTTRQSSTNTGSSGFGVSFGNTNGNNMNNTEQERESFVIASTESNESFVLQPNETKVVTLNIVVGGTVADQQAATMPTDGILGHLAGLAAKMTQDVYTYNVSASADVEGIALDPAIGQTLQIL